MLWHAVCGSYRTGYLCVVFIWLVSNIFKLCDVISCYRAYQEVAVWPHSEPQHRPWEVADILALGRVTLTVHTPTRGPRDPRVLLQLLCNEKPHPRPCHLRCLEHKLGFVTHKFTVVRNISKDFCVCVLVATEEWYHTLC